MDMESRQLRESLLTVRDGVAELRHQRPVQRNPMTLELRADYAETIDRVESDPTIRALVLTGDGGYFCAGGDVKGMAALTKDDAPPAAGFVRPRLRRDHMG